MSDTSSSGDHEQALTLMKFQLLFAAIFCEHKMNYLTPKSAQNNGYTIFWPYKTLVFLVDIAALLYCFLHFDTINIF